MKLENVRDDYLVYVAIPGNEDVKFSDYLRLQRDETSRMVGEQSIEIMNVQTTEEQSMIDLRTNLAKYINEDFPVVCPKYDLHELKEVDEPFRQVIENIPLFDPDSVYSIPLTAAMRNTLPEDIRYKALLSSFDIWQSFVALIMNIKQNVNVAMSRRTLNAIYSSIGE